MKLKEMENTVVNLRNEKEYNEFVKMRKDSDWELLYWKCAGNFDILYLKGCCTICVKVQKKFEWSDIDYYKRLGYDVITLEELKVMLTKDEEWEPVNGEIINVKYYHKTRKAVYFGRYDEFYVCCINNADFVCVTKNRISKHSTHNITLDNVEEIEISEEQYNAIIKLSYN